MCTYMKRVSNLGRCDILEPYCTIGLCLADSITMGFWGSGHVLRTNMCHILVGEFRKPEKQTKTKLVANNI